MKQKLSLILILLFSISSIPFVNSFSQDNIPDFSTKDRKDVPAEYKWKLEDIYQSVDDWKKDKSLVIDEIAKVEKSSADWTSDAQKMYSMLQLMDGIEMKLNRLYWYAGHQQNSDLGNTEFQKMKGDIQSVQVQYGSKTSFVNSDIIKLGEQNFKKYLQEEKGLESFRFGIEKILRMKDHVLPPEQEKIVSMTGLFSSSAEQAAGTLNDLEIPPAEATFSDGETVTLNYANYMKYRCSKNPEDRKLAMHTFWNNHKKFENTLATLLNSEIKSHYFASKVYNYNSCLETRLFSNKIDTSVYYQLVSSVNNNLEPLHKFLRLKKELLGEKSYSYDDIYASAVKSVDKEFPFNESKKIILEAVKPLGNEYTSL